jgi:hypothetical protein
MRTEILVLMALISMVLSACKPAAAPRSSAIPENVFLIDYAHEEPDVFYHGTVVLRDGKVSNDWTTQRADKKETQSKAMTESEFREVWESINDLPDLGNGAVHDPSQAIDLKGNHVIGIAYTLDGKKAVKTCMVPLATASPKFKSWLAKLGYSEGL